MSDGGKLLNWTYELERNFLIFNLFKLNFNFFFFFLFIIFLSEPNFVVLDKLEIALCS
jgi:hypothetical protein